MVFKYCGYLLFILIFTALSPSLLYSATCAPPTVLEGESIQSAIDDPNSDDTICIGVGTYTERLTLKEGVTLQGEELARTIIDGGGSGTVIKGAEASNIYNLTITNGDYGINVPKDKNMNIQNVIIIENDYGIKSFNTTTAYTVEIKNSVIDRNLVGIYCEDPPQDENESAITIINTIISNNTTDLLSSDDLLTISVLNNLIYNNDTTYYTAGDSPDIFDEDPLFVDTSLNDYHLQSGSPAIDAGDPVNDRSDPDGTQPDIGAYGESRMDETPFAVFGLSAEAGVSSLTMSWSANNAYNIDGYNLYFNKDISGEPYEGTVNAGNTTSYLLTGLPSDTPIPSVPAGLKSLPGDRSLYLSWNEVEGASGYIIYYGTVSGSYTDSVDAGNTTTYTLESLINDVVYYIVAAAYISPTYYLSVSAYDDTGDNESALINEISVLLLDKNQGLMSEEISDFPEESVPFPNLGDEGGCFIATAAYGSNMEPDVLLLRKFRDHFLLSNYPGRLIVDIYYRLSPPIAEYINNHEWLKPVTRAVISPFVLIARLSIETTYPQWLILFTALTFPLFIWVYVARKRKIA